MEAFGWHGWQLTTERSDTVSFRAGRDGNRFGSAISSSNCLEPAKACAAFEALEGSKLIRDTNNENSAKGRAIKLLDEANLLKLVGEQEEYIIKKNTNRQMR